MDDYYDLRVRHCGGPCAELKGRRIQQRERYACGFLSSVLLHLKYQNCGLVRVNSEACAKPSQRGDDPWRKKYRCIVCTGRTGADYTQDCSCWFRRVLAQIRKTTLQSLNKICHHICRSVLDRPYEYICVRCKILRLFDRLDDARHPEVDGFVGFACKLVYKPSNTWSAQFVRPLVCPRVKLQAMPSPNASSSTVVTEAIGIETTTGYDKVKAQEVHGKPPQPFETACKTALATSCFSTPRSTPISVST